MKEFTITTRDEKQRFDKYLKKLLPNATASFLYKMMRKKNICINHGKVSGNEILKAGDTVQLFFSDETFEKFHSNRNEVQREFEKLAGLHTHGLNIIYEDADILVADKPANMLSQKATADDVSANEYLLGYLIRSGFLTLDHFASFKPSVCNRLDRNTTGLLLMGKSLKGSQFLSLGLRDRSIQKYYYALVAGNVETEEHLEGYLIKNEAANTVVVTKEKPKDADAALVKTSYRPVGFGQDCTLLEVHLITGKTHQIRAHMASIGHPVIGDPKYGDARVNRFFSEKYHVWHQMLHARRVELADGRSFTAPMPKEMSRICKIKDR